MKERLDNMLVARGLAESREKAKAIIMSGIVYVDDQKEDKAGTKFEETVRIEVRGHTLPYVSRGGLKPVSYTHLGCVFSLRGFPVATSKGSTPWNLDGFCSAGA